MTRNQDHILDQLLEQDAERVEVPKGLLHRIVEAVEEDAKRLERLHVLRSGVKLVLVLGVMAYAIIASLLNLADAQTGVFLQALLEAPSLLFSSSGLLSFFERIPLLSMTLALVSAIYVFKHMAIHGIRRYPNLFIGVTASVVVVFGLGTFMGGLALGSKGSPNLQILAGKTLYEPIADEDSFKYSSVGTVVSEPIPLADGGYAFEVEAENGEQTEIRSMVAEDIEKGDSILIIGQPASAEAEEGPAIYADFLKLLE